MAGALSAGWCYSSQGEALDAYYGSVPPSRTAGAISYVQQFVKESGVWKSQTYSIDGSVVSLVSVVDAPSVVFPECNPLEGLSDGMVLGWGLASALIAVAAVMFMRRGAR